MDAQNTYLIKKPVLTTKLALNFNNPAGDIVEEIQEQDLSGQTGGSVSAWIITTITGLSAVVTSAVLIVSASATNPGRYCTVSAECSFDGNSCA